MSPNIFDYKAFSDQDYINHCNETLRNKGIYDQTFSRVEEPDSFCRYKLTRQSDGLSHFFSYRLQSYGLTDGIESAARCICEAYHLQALSFSSNDVIVDIGANTGNLELYLRLKSLNYLYVGIEPGPVEFACLSRNVIQSQAVLLNAALGPATGYSDLYLSSESGDSSIIQPRGFTSSIRVKVLTLDTIVDRIRELHPAKKLRLLKLEAEGYEPEILEGGHRSLLHFDYISADIGWERGIDQETTAPDVLNKLLSIGFRIEKIGRTRMTVLLRNSLTTS